MEDPGLHAQALKPPSGTGDLAAAEDVVDPVRQEHHCQTEPEYEEGKVRRMQRKVAEEGASMEQDHVADLLKSDYSFC